MREGVYWGRAKLEKVYVEGHLQKRVWRVDIANQRGRAGIVA